MNAKPDIDAARLSREDYADNFADIRPPLTGPNALVEADRCYFCFDAPCVTACPTGIDVPGFIRKIKTGNLAGAGMEILRENIFGGACARVCPTEVLCEQACVRTMQEGKPVAIGLLQRHATDPLLDRDRHPFRRGPATGQRVAVVGAGPAGLACAHGLAVAGHDVTVFEARDKASGLNEYGVAAYKLVDEFAGHEVAFVLGIGGIELRTGRALGRELDLTSLRQDFDAVFLGLGQQAVRALDGDDALPDGVLNAVDYIADLRQADDLAELPVGRQVVVVGGGNTAIDIAVQSRKLGAEHVTIAYRRGPAEMGATPHELEFAKTNGVQVMSWVQPTGFVAAAGRVRAVVMEETCPGTSRAAEGTGRMRELPCDIVFMAIGQGLDPAPLAAEGGAGPKVENGRIVVDAGLRTSLPDVWAGGDCVAGLDLTVQAVQDGKVAARSIDSFLRD